MIGTATGHGGSLGRIKSPPKEMAPDWKCCMWRCVVKRNGLNPNLVAFLCHQPWRQLFFCPFTAFDQLLHYQPRRKCSPCQRTSKNATHRPIWPICAEQTSALLHLTAVYYLLGGNVLIIDCRLLLTRFTAGRRPQCTAMAQMFYLPGDGSPLHVQYQVWLIYICLIVTLRCVASC